jgi:hypothetical protein
MEDELKKALLAKMEEIRRKGTRDDMQRAIDMYREKGFTPAHSTEETAARGKELLADKRMPEKMVTRVPGQKEIIDDTIRVPSKGGLEERDAKLAAHRARRKAIEQVAGGEKGLRKAISKVTKRGLKALPLVGGIVSAMESGDASAAIPVLGDAESTGPEQGSLESVIEDPTASDDMRRQAIERLRKRSEVK